MSALRRRRGLTLMELMISIGIVVVISGVGWASVGDAVELNAVLARGDSTTRSARVALGRLRRELQLAYLSPYSRTTQNVQTIFVGEDDDPDTMYFASLAHQRLYRNTAECDQTEITVWGERGGREQGPGDILYHREAERIDEFPDESGRIWPLAYNVRTFNARYLDGRTFEWVDEWDSRNAEYAGRLPRAVQLGLVLLNVDPEDEDEVLEVPFLTTVPLEYAEPVVSQGILGLDPTGMGMGTQPGGGF
jgi:general secretion pathway protein J